MRERLSPAATIASAFTSGRQSLAAQGEEILETLGMAIYMGARPAAMSINNALGANTLRRAQVGRHMTSERQDVV